jgi:hypothetical protein
MGTGGKNLDLFWEIFYRKINLQIRDTVYMNALNMVLLCDKFWPFGEKKKKGTVTLTKDFFLQYLKEKNGKKFIF